MDIQEKLEGLYFFQFSEGSYSYYSVGGIYVCDHQVTEKEWVDHYQKYQDEVAELRKSIITVDFRHPSNYGQSLKFEEERIKIAPEQSFIALHKMYPVDSEEFWRNC